MADEVYVGVDLAAADKKTGLCVLTWPDQIEICHVQDGEILERLRSEATTAAAIDAPFGWPVAFMEALCAWDPDSLGRRRAPYDGNYPEPVVREPLCYRHTDRFVRFVAKQLAEDAKTDVGAWPAGLSVSTNMIGATALRAVGLLHKALADPLDKARSDLPIVADWSPNVRFVEAYPATTLNAWGITTRRGGHSYKGNKDHRGVRELVVKDLLKQIRPVNQPLGGAIEEHHEDLVATDDALDAFVCCLVARAWRMGQTWSLDHDGDYGRSAVHKLLTANDKSAAATKSTTVDDLVAAATREGWIAHPHASLEDVVRI